MQSEKPPSTLFLDALVEALEPPAQALVVIYVMLRPAEPALGLPTSIKSVVVESRRVGLGPEAEMPARGLVDGTKPRQFDGRPRELRDLR